MYDLLCNDNTDITDEKIFDVVHFLHQVLKGSYSLLLIIKDYGMIAIRDNFGIRPLIYGKKDNKYIISSESVSLNLLDYEIIRDLKAGETIIFRNDQKEPIHNFYENSLRFANR